LRRLFLHRFFSLDCCTFLDRETGDHAGDVRKRNDMVHIHVFQSVVRHARIEGAFRILHHRGPASALYLRKPCDTVVKHSHQNQTP
jgi:hypothetical protein